MTKAQRKMVEAYAAMMGLELPKKKSAAPLPRILVHEAPPKKFVRDDSRFCPSKTYRKRTKPRYSGSDMSARPQDLVVAARRAAARARDATCLCPF